MRERAGVNSFIVRPEIIENFYQISASNFLALYEINETDLTYWSVHQNTSI